MDLPTETGNPKSTEIMLTGPHEGKTFQEIWENEHQYCHWVRLTADTTPPRQIRIPETIDRSTVSPTNCTRWKLLARKR